MRPEIIDFKDELYEVGCKLHMQLIIRDAREYMKTLTPRQARVSHMYFTEGLTLEQISEVENTTVTAIKAVISRVSGKLRDRYGT